MASLHATQVWFVDMNIPKNSIPDFISTARAAVPARAVEMKNRDLAKKMLGLGFEPRITAPEILPDRLDHMLAIVRRYNDIKLRLKS